MLKGLPPPDQFLYELLWEGLSGVATGGAIQPPLYEGKGCSSSDSNGAKWPNSWVTLSKKGLHEEYKRWFTHHHFGRPLPQSQFYTALYANYGRSVFADRRPGASGSEAPRVRAICIAPLRHMREAFDAAHGNKFEWPTPAG